MEKVIDAYKEGKSINSIAKEMDCSPTKVRKILLDNGIKLRKKWDWCVKTIDKEAILRDIKEKIPLIEIAKKHHVHPKTITRNLRIWMPSVAAAATGKRGRPRLAMQDYDEIERLYLDGVSINQLSKRFRYSDEIIKQRLQAKGITIRNQHLHKRFDKANLEDMKTLYSQGWSLYKLGKKYKISEETIIKRFKEDGISIRGKHDPMYKGNRGKPRKNLPDELIKTAHLSGESPASIAQRIGVHTNTIRNRIKEFNLLR